MEILETKTDVGLIREKNEDAAIVERHPENPNIKLLLVADGMGGKNNGQLAANYVAYSIQKWFLNKEVEILLDPEKTSQLLKRYIKVLNTNLLKKYGRDNLGTTLTLAIVGPRKTLILNAGDSRAYVVKKKELLQVTEDDSEVWMYFKYGGVKKDDLRYFPTNNVITACVGICNELCNLSEKIISNRYEMLLLVTDGITDMITDKKIKSITRKIKKENILQTIVNEAVAKDQNLKVPKYLRRRYKYRFIVPFKGRDNATGAIYIK